MYAEAGLPTGRKGGHERIEEDCSRRRFGPKIVQMQDCSQANTVRVCVYPKTRQRRRSSNKKIPRM